MKTGVLSALASLVVLCGLAAWFYHLGGKHARAEWEATVATERAAHAAEIAEHEAFIAAQAEAMKRVDDYSTLLEDSLAAGRLAYAALQRSAEASEAASRDSLGRALTAADSLRAIPGLVTALDDCTALRRTCEHSLTLYEDLTASQDTAITLRDRQLAAERAQRATTTAALNAAQAQLALRQDRTAPRLHVGGGVLVQGRPEGGTTTTGIVSVLWGVDVPLLPRVTVQTAAALDFNTFAVTAHVGL